MDEIGEGNCVTYRICAWAVLGTAQSTTIAIINGYKARKSGLKFELMRVLMALFFLEDRVKMNIGARVLALGLSGNSGLRK
jgi:hypothetical protein